MKKIIIGFLLLINLNGSGIPVVDVAHIAQTVAIYAQKIMEWKQHLDEWKQLTEVKDSVQFIKDVEQLQKVMKEWKVDLFDLDLNNPKSQIGVLAKQLFDKYNLFDDCSYSYFSQKQKDICKRKMVRKVQEIATYQMFSEELTQRANKLETLSLSLARSKDEKESQDIGNAIQMELAQLQITKTQIDLMKANNEAKERVEQRQKEQLFKEKQINGKTW
jgi:type IV secretion system protein VirB5